LDVKNVRKKVCTDGAHYGFESRSSCLTRRVSSSGTARYKSRSAIRLWNEKRLCCNKKILFPKTDDNTDDLFFEMENSNQQETMNPDSQNGGGMSRAAKKRAKKNKKKMEQHKAAGVQQEAPKKKAKLDVDDETNSKATKDPETVKQKECDERKVETTGDDSADATTDLPTFEDADLREILLLKEPKDEETKTQLEGLHTEQRAACLFQAIIHPIPLADFYKEYWEKKPLLVRAKNKRRYEGLLSLESIKETTKEKALYYCRDLNVTKYIKDESGVKRRLTLDKLPQKPEEEETGVAVNSKELWKNYDNGCTIRLLCPQKHEDSVHTLLSTLELELQCMVGANAYLTPPNASQGFAPHYDDIEAFCLQLQGSKRWKVYQPTLKLPRTSSEDFSVEEVEGLTQVMDVTLEEGDLLYMPRGWIHQACTLKDNNGHSLHLTVSAMQQWAWADLLDMVMPEALEATSLSETYSSLRQGLPRGFMDYMGAMYEEPSDEKMPDSLKKVAAEDEQAKYRKILQEHFRAEAKKRIMKVAKAVRLSLLINVCSTVCFSHFSTIL
jgi:ribosomal protein L16 Arg81 hydroxylase